MTSLLLVISLCLLSHAMGNKFGDGVTQPVVAANNCSVDGRTVNVYCHCDGSGTKSVSDGPVPCQTGNAAEPTQPPPALVAFSVGATNRFAPSASTRIPFNVVLYNDGRYFHTDNAFYAPVKGIYAFTFSGASEGNKWIQITLYTQKKDEAKVAVARAVDYGGGAGYGTASGSVMIRLEPGESVSVWTENSHIVLGTTPPSTLFSGELKLRL